MGEYFYENSAPERGGRRHLFDNVFISTVDRSPCPVCGHPTGDCSDGGKPPTGIIGETLTITSLLSLQTFYVEEDIYEERQVTPFNKIRVLLYPRGKVLEMSEAIRAGLVKE